MTGRGLICLAFLIAAPSSVSAQQEIQSLEPGQWVRINGEIEGHFRAVTDDSFIFGKDRLPLESVTQLEVFPLASIKRLEVLTGQRRATKKGAVIGGLVFGIPTAFIWGTLSAAFECGLFCESDSSYDIGAGLAGLVVGGLAGAGVGALIGARLKSDRWEDVSLDKVRLSLMPQLDGGVALGMQLKF